MDQQAMVHLHNGILCSRKKEEAPTLCDSMDETGEHYAKWNKPGSEGQMSYDLTFNWNNKTNKQAKYNQRHWNKNNLTVTRGEVGGDNVETHNQKKSHNVLSKFTIFFFLNFFLFF